VRYGSERENWVSDLVSAATAAFTGYGFSSLSKLGGNPVYPLIGEASVGVLGVGLKHLTDSVVLHEVLEAAGYGGLYGVGWWLGETTTTIGGRPAGAPPFWHPGATTAASGGAASHALAALKAARAQAGQAQAGQALLPPTPQKPLVPGYPDISSAPYGEAYEAEVELAASA
jgi:hypothetical protein